MTQKTTNLNLNGSMEFGLGFKPGLGKDKRGVSGVDKKTLVQLVKKYLKSQKILIFTKL